jgi:hypothetical protein
MPISGSSGTQTTGSNAQQQPPFDLSTYLDPDTIPVQEGPFFHNGQDGTPGSVQLVEFIDDASDPSKILWLSESSD